MASSKGVVVPNRLHSVDPSCSPLKLAMGTSTCGVRMPPRAFPFASRTIAAGGPGSTSRRGAERGGLPRRTQRSSAARAAFTTKCCGPELIGVPQRMMPGTGVDVITRSTTSGESPRSTMPRASE